MSRWAFSLAMIVVASGVAFGQPQGFPMAPPPNVLERSECLEAPPASVFDNLHHGGPSFVSGEAEYLLALDVLGILYKCSRRLGRDCRGTWRYGSRQRPDFRRPIHVGILAV